MSEYMQFVDRVRQNEVDGIEQPIKEAIKWCVENGVLQEFLSTRKEEVLKAMTIDMTWEAREKIIRRDERAEGREEGRQEGRNGLIRNALKRGKTPEMIAEFFDIPIEEVMSVVKEMEE